jgi:hypothetical protein
MEVGLEEKLMEVNGGLGFGWKLNECGENEERLPKTILIYKSAKRTRPCCKMTRSCV